MMQDSSTIPHGWQLVYLAIAGVLSSLATLVVDRIKNRKREPAEVDKLRAETKNIHVNAENAQASVGLELLREVQAAIEKAEVRREAWLLKEEQLRGQVLFWRTKAEELDGQLIDSCDANVRLNARLKLKQAGLDKAAALIHYHSITFSEVDMPEVKALIDILKAHAYDETTLDHPRD